VELHARAKVAVMASMGTKSREVIWGGQIMGAEITARSARHEAKKAARKADRADAYAGGQSEWKAMAGQRSHPPPSASAIHGGLGWLEVECNRRNTRASLPLDASRRPRDTPI
jgi:hypothetical protein